MTDLELLEYIAKTGKIPNDSEGKCEDALVWFPAKKPQETRGG